MSEKLEITTLGGLALRRNDQPLPDLGSRKAEALFIYLVCTRRPHTREALADLLWDELAPAQAGGGLRVVLTKLRPELGSYLTISHATVAFDLTSPHWLDVAAFEQQLDIAHQQAPATEPLSVEAVQALEAAVALYRGQFLRGFSIRGSLGFEEWLRQEQQRLEKAARQALQALITLYGEQQEYGLALQHTGTLLRLDPLDEEVQRQMMRRLAETGQRSAALEQYRTYQRLLEAEYKGGEPAPETTALYEAIRSGAVGPRPAPPTARPPVHNLPRQLTSFIGREQEVATISGLLRQPVPPLVTLTGPGGVGKTRLAQQVAAAALDEFPDGCWFVDLAPLGDPDQVVPTIATVLRVPEQGQTPLLDTLTSFLQPKRLLLVLDNCEQVLKAARMIADLLKEVPRLRMLVTSRSPLRVYGEKEFAVPALAVPARAGTGGSLPPLDQLRAYPAVRLFVERAQDVKHDFQLTNANAPAVVAICARLDGLPLAIELAAARIRLFPPQTLLDRLERRLEELADSATNRATRQQTLRGTIEWSYDLLEPAEQSLFRRLAVFGGGCTLEAAETVCGAASLPPLGIAVLAGLEVLLEGSLIRREDQPGGETRFGMLQTISEYAQERLEESGVRPRLRAAHALTYLELAQAAQPHLAGREQAHWMKRLDQELDNLRTAVAWGLETDEVELVARIGWALWPFMLARGYLSEGRRWLEAALDNPALAPALRAETLRAAGILAHDQGDYARAEAYFQENLALRRQFGDRAGIAGALNALGVLLLRRGDYAGAQPYYEESMTLLRALDDQPHLAVAFNNLGVLAERMGNYVKARTYYRRSLKLARRLDDPEGTAWALDNLGNIACEQRDYVRAEALHRESLALFQALGHKQGLAACLEHLAGLAGAQGQAARAARLFGYAAALRAATGIVIHPSNRASYKQRLDAAQAQTDPATWKAAWAAGQAASLEEVLNEFTPPPGDT